MERFFAPLVDLITPKKSRKIRACNFFRPGSILVGSHE